MNIIFMGTSLFALPVLEMLVREKYNVTAVYTKPDKPHDRGMKVIEGEIKHYAVEQGLTVRTPEKLNPEEREMIASLHPDCIVVVSYGLKIPRSILDIPRFGAVNAHASLLPKFRGAAPIQAAILDGEKETGVTVFRLTEEWDAGDIVAMDRIEIGAQERGGELWERLRHLAPLTMSKALQSFETNTASYLPQDHSQATFAKKITKEDGHIHWENSAVCIERLVRAYCPWPMAHTHLSKIFVKIHAVTYETVSRRERSGSVFAIDCEKGIGVVCGEGVIYISELQLEGKRKMYFKDFLNGHQLKVGDRFGES